jgi:SOS response regulatory protein OraA/RecX
MGIATSLGDDDQRPNLIRVLSKVIQALIDQGYSVNEITQAMHHVADITDVVDQVYGDKM